jgi:outer membrane protein
MKRLPVFALLLVLASVVAAAGQTTTSPTAQKPAVSTAAGPAKVAVVAFQAAVTQTNEFQRDFADLQKKYDPKRAQLKKLSDEIDNLTKQLQTQGAQLTDSERASRSHAIDEKKRQLDRDTKDAQTDFENDAQQLLNTLAGKVGAVMTDLAAKLGFTLVLDTSDQQNPTVLYAISSIDITKAVIDAYNLKSGVPAPPEHGAGEPAVDAPQPMPAPAH